MLVAQSLRKRNQVSKVEKKVQKRDLTIRKKRKSKR